MDYPERGVPSLLELGVVAALRPLHWSESLCCGGARREETESEMTWPSSAALQTAAFSPSYLCVESPLRGILSLTTHRQSDSMVEIRQETTDTSSPPGEDEAKYRLIYTKSKVYVNPTAYARDNIPGFVAIVKRVRIPFVPSCHSPPSDLYSGGTYFDVSSCMDPRTSSVREGSRRMGQVSQDRGASLGR